MLLALFVATVGHSAWDNVLHWMIVNDPDTSILHMHWLRMLFVYVFMWLVPSNSQKRTARSTCWWFAFSMYGWTLPAIAYTICVMLSGYRIAVSFQPFIPLFVALQTGAPLEGYRLMGLNFAMLGTLSVWVWSPWYHKDPELWKIWVSIICALVQVVSLSRWFSMLPETPIAYMRHGVGLSLCTIFFVMIIWAPENIAADFFTRPDKWLAILIGAGIVATCKNWVISSLSSTMRIDSVAIFECLHPIATLCSDVILRKDMFEYEDIITITLLAIGWILYPKRNI